MKDIILLSSTSSWKIAGKGVVEIKVLVGVHVDIEFVVC
jgi:hypothetical protein